MKKFTLADEIKCEIYEAKTFARLTQLEEAITDFLSIQNDWVDLTWEDANKLWRAIEEKEQELLEPKQLFAW